MEKPEEQSESEISLDKVRAERERARENEVGYKLGKSMGKQLRSSWLLVLPIQFAVGPVLFGFIGAWLDGKLGTSPGFTLGGVVLGLAASVLTLIRTLKEVQD